MALNFSENSYDWAEYKRVERGHAKGNHERCNYRHCLERRQIEDLNEAHLDAKAMFAELAMHHIDPRSYFGDDYDAARDLADMEFPDWLPQDLDFINRFRAKADLDTYRLNCR
jgi:hypothetical protein